MMKILNKIIKKEATVQEKLTYLLPAVISILYLIDVTLFLILEKGLFRRLIPEFLNISKIIFIFTSIYAAYKNYDYFKKVNATSLLFVIICFFWIFDLLYPMLYYFWVDFFVSVITLIQIYLFLNLYLDKKFNILNIDSVSSSFNLDNLDFSKEKFNLNLLKNKFVIGALILFGVFIFHNIFSEDSHVYKINIYDPKNRFYNGDKLRIMPVAEGASCGERAMGKSGWLPFSRSTIVPCDRQYYNCAVMGDRIQLCLFEK